MDQNDFEEEPTNVILRWDGSDSYYNDNQDTLDKAFWLGVDLSIDTDTREKKA